MRIAIAAGGTGGHIYPGIAVAQELSAEILFIGSHEGMEKNIVPRYGFKLELIKSRALLRKISYQAISAPFIVAWGFFQALALLLKFKPDLIFSTGGYVGLPVILAGKILGLPIYVQEQNVLPGIVNQFCFRFAKKIFLSFEETLRSLRLNVAAPGNREVHSPVSGRYIVTGNPVRKEILSADRTRSRQKLKLDPDKKTILILGGSQGAQKINEAVLASLEKFPSDRFEAVHIIGERDFGWAQRYFKEKNYSFYHPFSYLYNVEDALAAADLVVSRAGATAIAEFLSRNLPMVLVPFPYSAEGHQDLNAKIVEENGCAIVVRNQDFTAEKFLALLNDSKINWEEMKHNCKKLARPNAAKEIAATLC